MPPPATVGASGRTTHRRSSRSAAAARAPEASLALPAISPFIEECILGHVNWLTPIRDALEASFAFPPVSRETQEGVLG
jgi:hypothetical protein